MKYQLHPNAWVAVDYNTAMRKDDTDDKVTNNFVTEFKESKQQSIIEEIYEDNNNRKIYSSKNNDVYLIKKGRKNTRDQRFSRSIKKSSSISKKVDRKYTYTILVPKVTSSSHDKKINRSQKKSKYYAKLMQKLKPEKYHNQEKIAYNLSMQFLRINTWFQLYVGYTFLLVYFLIILYYRSYLEIYHISTMDSK